MCTITYGNGFSENYVYNDLELLSEIWYTNSTANTLAYSYEYTSDGLLYKFIDHINGKTTVYKYDCNGRITDSAEFDSDEYLNVFSTRVLYDDEEVSAVYYYLDHLNGTRVDATQWNISFTYEHDGVLTESRIQTALTTGSDVYTYDDYDRVTSISKVHYLNSNSSTRFSNTVSYTYVNSSSNTSGRIATYSSTVNGTNTTYTYTYDNRGNITKIQYSNGQEIRYYYDDIGQLIREDNEPKYSTYVYKYDNAGNLTNKQTYSTAAEGEEPSYLVYDYVYGYSASSWGDLLTSFRGTQITYDPIGNPLNYYNGTNYEFKWSGRQLKEALVGNQYVYCTYNDEGYRATKTYQNKVTTYYLDGSRITAEETSGNVTVYLYDASGAPIGMQYHASNYAEDDWDIFWYDKNLQGDIVAVYNEAGTKLVSYTYDAWGGFTRFYHNGGSSTVAGNNPFLYRGYYYDKDLQLYYLNARYYDPAVGRFISADDIDYLGADGSPLSYNLFAYCMNNPVNNFDVNGNWSMPNWLKVTVGAVAIAGLAVATVCTGGAAAVICGAALSGAIAGGASGAVMGAIGGGISGGWQGALDGACSGFMSGTLIGGATGAASAGLNIATGATTVVGNAHGSTLHKLATNMEAGKMAASGQYSQIGINKSLGKMGLNGGLTRPDVIGIGKNGVNKLVEVVSPRQSTTYISTKMSNMLSNNPGTVGKIVNWVRRLFK